MGRVTDSRWRWWFIAIAFALLTGCGGSSNGGEYVWLQVFNAYPGAEAVSVYGPSGTITSNLQYGDRTSGFIRVNRNLGSELQLVLSGAPQPFSGDISLYNLYPQESGTLVINRRTGSSQVNVEIVRHVRSALSESPPLRAGYSGPTCRTVFSNKLSVQNSGLAQFDVIPRMQIESACTGYARFVETTGGTYDACDPDLGRPGLMRAMFGPNACSNPNGSINTDDASQWFIPVREQGGGANSRSAIASVSQCTAVEGTGPDGSEPFDSLTTLGSTQDLAFVYAGPAEVTSENQDQAAYAPQIDFAQDQILAAPPTNEFMSCIGYNRQASLQQNKMEIDPQNVEACRAGATFTPVSIQPGSTLNPESIIATAPGVGVGRGPDECGYPIQITSDFLNVFETPESGETALLTSEDQPINYSPGQHFYWYLYGRPVNPRIETWSVNPDDDRSGGTIDPGPYPDGER